MSYWHVKQKTLTTVIPRCYYIPYSYFLQVGAEYAMPNLFSIGLVTYLVMKNNKNQLMLSLCTII